MSSINQSTNSTAHLAATFQDPSKTNPLWDKEGVFDVKGLSELAQKVIFSFVGATDKGIKDLALVERSIYFKAVKGIEPAQQAQIPALYTLIFSPEERAIAIEAYQNSVKTLTNPVLSFRTEFVASFISKIALYLEERYSISPAEFHDIMGREFFLRREKNQPKNSETTPDMNFAFNLDYASHIARAFELAKLTEGNTEQNLKALLKIDLTKLDPRRPLKDNFECQKFVVEKIRECGNTGTQLVIEDHFTFSLPPHIGELEKLEVLNLYRNRLENLPIEIGKLKNLKHLALAINYLTRVPSELKNLTQLTELMFLFNQATSDPVTQDVFKTLREKEPKCRIAERACRGYE